MCQNCRRKLCLALGLSRAGVNKKSFELCRQALDGNHSIAPTDTNDPTQSNESTQTLCEDKLP